MRVGQRHHTLNVGPRWVTLLQRHPHHTGPNVAHVGTRHLPVSDWEEPVHLSWEPHPPLAHRQWGAPQTLPWQLQLEPWLCRCKHRHLVRYWKDSGMGKRQQDGLEIKIGDWMGWGRGNGLQIGAIRVGWGRGDVWSYSVTVQFNIKWLLTCHGSTCC